MKDILEFLSLPLPREVTSKKIYIILLIVDECSKKFEQ